MSFEPDSQPEPSVTDKLDEQDPTTRKPPCQDHDWAPFKGVDKCKVCGISFRDHVNGVSVCLRGFTTKSKRTRGIKGL